MSEAPTGGGRGRHCRSQRPSCALCGLPPTSFLVLLVIRCIQNLRYCSAPPVRPNSCILELFPHDRCLMCLVPPPGMGPLQSLADSAAAITCRSRRASEPGVRRPRAGAAGGKAQALVTSVAQDLSTETVISLPSASYKVPNSAHPVQPAVSSGVWIFTSLMGEK